MADLLRDTYEKGKRSPPEVIAQLITKAVNTRHPKPRYHGGYQSGLALASRWLLSDITGATGMIGKGVLLECLESPKVASVLVISDRPRASGMKSYAN